MSEMVIWKYPVEPVTEIEIPGDAEVLTVQVQHGKPQMWVLLDPDKPRVKRSFAGLKTGKEYLISPEKRLDYIGTFQLEGGYLVFHLFEVIEKGPE